MATQPIIIYEKNGLDSNGNTIYYYNFFKDDHHRMTVTREARHTHNELFKFFGRQTPKSGIRSQLSPEQLQKLLLGDFMHDFSDNSETHAKLVKAQKDIDSCNSRKGCNTYCTTSTQSSCAKIVRHSRLLNLYYHIGSFKKAKLIPLPSGKKLNEKF